MNNYYLSCIARNNAVLMHSGRKGMKWYQHIFTSGKDLAGRVRQNRRAKSDRKVNGKLVSTMTNEELTKAINRMDLEKRYLDTYSRRYPDRGAAVKSFIGKFASEFVSAVAKDVAPKLIGAAVDKALSGSDDKTKGEKKEKRKVM